MSILSKTISKVEKQTKTIIRRTADRHIRLAVTGLSGAGKTAFITGLVNQLLRSGNTFKEQALPLWHVAREQRLLGVERQLQPDLEIASFDYQGGINSLTASPNHWPASTRNISEIRLAIHFQPKSGVLSKFTDRSTLILDIVDYPGEWLLDLPLLKTDYQTWSFEQLQNKHKLEQSTCYSAFLSSLSQLDLTEKADNEEIAKIAELYRNALLDLVNNKGFYLAQPGRMLLPGDLDGSPLVNWFPLSHLTAEQWALFTSETDDNSYFKVLAHRFNSYKEKVVKPFYRNHFSKFDRQIVLVDSLTALNNGQAQFNDMASALSNILSSFQFGDSNILRRLFAPRIDKLLFAASKVDHITRDQQTNLLYLLNDMLQESRQFASIKGCDVETMAISAIKATKHGLVTHQGKQIEAVFGRKNNDRSDVTLYPGDVPKALPKKDFWQQQGFNFVNFAPPESLQGEVKPMLEHIRLDHLLQFLLGDKLD
ncbi:YcjX family protein [Shewanella sp. 202IG2-18]|uniref:YcjX family protein n=1 Tax=Parashewanella hymeniacidonis TaxID=2807618 RepID=UPI001961D703|nr:YcjX family protein [Parashewanella hymeniacidonis]MBM7073785.1 YcjX family protein [Parashewanella hymeniacidonis]